MVNWLNNNITQVYLNLLQKIIYLPISLLYLRLSVYAFYVVTGNLTFMRVGSFGGCCSIKVHLLLKEVDLFSILLKWTLYKCNLSGLFLLKSRGGGSPVPDLITSLISTHTVVYVSCCPRK